MDEKEIERLMKEYENVEVPEGLFDLEEVFRKGDIIKKRQKIIKSTVRVAAVFIIGMIIAIVLLLKAKNPDEVMQQGRTITETENVSYQKEIFAENNIKGYGIKYLNDKVYSIKLKKILEYSSITKDNYTYPITKVQAEVLNTFSGNTVEEITFWIPGGIWTVEELKASDYIYNSDELNGLDNNDNIYLKYYERYKIEKPELDKIYLVTLYEENNEIYVQTNVKYGFKEYNPESNCILNSNGDWEPVDIEEYLK